MERPKVYDSFPYNGEPIVWLRLKVHDPFVDHFYIIESRYTFSGQRKEVLYSEMYKESFQPYLPKITFLILEDYLELDLSFSEWMEKYEGLSSDWMIDKEAWYRENYQREVVQRYLKEATNYVLIVTDCDEIVRPYVLQELPNMYSELSSAPVFLKMDMYNYNFSWYKNLYWELGFVVNDKFLHSNTFRKTYRSLLSVCRMVRTLHIPTEILSIDDCGWHCSYFMSLEDIVRKVSSFAHVEFYVPEHLTYEHVDKCIREGKELFGRDVPGKVTPDMLLPGDYQGLPNGWEEFQKELVTSQTLSRKRTLA